MDPLTLFFAAVAAFVFFKLFSVLGRRTGHERPPPAAAGGNGAEADDGKVVPLRRRDDGTGDAAALDASLEAGLARIRQADRDFDPERFLAGARAAFEMILDAFHKGELEKVRRFLDAEVHRGFARAVEDRDAGDAKRLVELVAINRCELAAASMEGPEARVTVRFESDQTDVVKDSEERIVAGDPTAPVEVTDLWTFARDTRSRDPNWLLVATRAPR